MDKGNIFTSTECSICFEEDVSMILYQPCGHRAVCAECDARDSKGICALCQQPISERLAVAQPPADNSNNVQSQQRLPHPRNADSSPPAPKDWKDAVCACPGWDNSEWLKECLTNVDVAGRNNWPIRWAARNGHIEVVRLLLADKRVNPAAGYNNAILLAAENGHTEVVRLLLADGRADPAANNNWAVRRAAANRHANMVRLLLTDHRVDFDLAMRGAWHCCYTCVVALSKFAPK